MSDSTICKSKIFSQSRCLLIGCWLAFLLAFFISSAESSSRIASYEGDAASRVAVNSSGDIYISSYINNNLRIRRAEGTFIKGFYIQSPVSLHISAGDVVYVGSENGTVYKLQSNEVIPFVQVELPASIGTSLAGDVYVLDASASKIRIFSSIGTPLGTFGLKGTCNGCFTGPLSLAVTDSEVYVVDMGSIISGKDLAAPRIQAFSLQGNFSRSFGTYGLGDGMLLRPVSLSTDNQGRLYVADVEQQVVQVLDGSGAHVSTIYDPNHALSLPVNVSYNKGLVYVVSALSKRVDVLATDDAISELTLPDGNQLNFEAGLCGEALTYQELRMDNSGPFELSWQVQSTVPWATPVHAAGTIGGYGSDYLNVAVDPLGLAPGTYHGVLTLSAGVARKDVDIRLTVDEAPIFTLSSQTASLSWVNGQGVSSFTVFVSLNGEGLQWQALSSQPWLGVTPQSGPSNTTSNVQLDLNTNALQGIGSGQYSATVLLASNCQGVSPVEINVTLEYKAGGSLYVATGLDEASFTVSGPGGSFSGTGRTLELQGLPEGQYVVQFAPVRGFLAPSAREAFVIDGQRTLVEVAYKDLREQNLLVVSPNGGRSVRTDEARIFGLDGQLVMSYIFSDGTGSAGSGQAQNAQGYSTAVGDVDGDGVADIVVAYDSGVIAGYTKQGMLLEGAMFRAFDKAGRVELALADINNDGKVEVLAAQAEGLAQLKVFAYDGAGVLQLGEPWQPQQYRDGLAFSVGDVDGDGRPEIVTASRAQGKRDAVLTLWHIALDEDNGGFLYAPFGEIQAGFSFAGAELALADINADGRDEVTVATLQTASGRSILLQCFNAEGIKLSQFDVPSHGAMALAAGDMDLDGVAELVIGSGDVASGVTRVGIYGPDGTLKGMLIPYGEESLDGGARLTMGDLR